MHNQTSLCRAKDLKIEEKQKIKANSRLDCQQLNQLAALQLKTLNKDVNLPHWAEELGISVHADSWGNLCQCNKYPSMNYRTLFPSHHLSAQPAVAAQRLALMKRSAALQLSKLPSLLLNLIELVSDDGV